MLLDSLAADLDPAIDYTAQLCSGGYRKPNGIKQADNAEQIQRACGWLPWYRTTSRAVGTQVDIATAGGCEGPRWPESVHALGQQ